MFRCIVYKGLSWDERGGYLSYGGKGVVGSGWIIRMCSDRCSLNLLQCFGNSVYIAIRRVEWRVVVVLMLGLCIGLLFLTIYRYHYLYSEWCNDVGNRG